MKIKLGLLLVACVIAVTAFSVNNNSTSENNNLLNEISSEVGTNTDGVIYNSVSADWLIYEDVADLVEKSNIVVLGKITDISFQVLDMRTAQPPTKDTEEWNHSLYTIYDVEVITSYKGKTSDTIQFRMMGGRKDMLTNEQLTTLGQDSVKGISIMDDMPEIQIGESYLLALYQYQDTIPTLINVEQGIFDTREPLTKDSYSNVSLKDVVSFFGADKWNEFEQSN